MTQVEQIYTEERIEAVRAAVEETERKNQAEKEAAALRLLRERISVKKVAYFLDMPVETVKSLKQTLL